MKERTLITKLLTVLLTLCMVLSLTAFTAYAGELPKPDYLPEGVTYSNDYDHTYHTQVNVTANVSVKDSDGTVVETTQVSKSTEEFLKGGVGMLQSNIARLQTEIETPYQDKGTLARENESGQSILDHFESAELYTFIPTSGDPVEFGMDLDAAKKYFNEHPDATGTFTEILDVHEYQKYNYTYDLNVQQTGQPESTITAATIENVKFDYQLGDAPQATAAVAAADQGKYRIYDECWQELNENDEPVAIWHSNDRMYSTLPTITAFESGKKYVYSVLLMPEGEYDFARKVAATVNGNTVTAVPAVDGYLSLPNVKTITPTGSINPTVIDLIEINDVTVSFKDGDKPKFTGSVPDNAGYAFRCEWWSLDSNTGIVSTEPEWGGDIYKNKITAFEAGKTYHYGVYVTAYTANISPDAKLKINGREVEYTRIGDENDTQSFWVETNLTMTPTSYPAKKEIPVVEINNATLTFKDGDKPVFTGTTPNDAPYVLVFEEWRTDGEWTRSDEWFNDADHHGNDKDITAFDKNKSYNYTFYIKTNLKAYEEGWCFGQNTKLKINGKEVSFTRDVSDSEYHFSGTTGITMTPTADGHTHSYGKTWIYDSANHWHECSCGDKSDTAAHTFKWVTDKEATATEKGSKHEECTVCGYKKAAVVIPATGSGSGSADQPNKPGNTSSPQTGDNNSLALWFAVLLISGGVLAVLGVVPQKRRKNVVK